MSLNSCSSAELHLRVHQKLVSTATVWKDGALFDLGLRGSTLQIENKMRIPLITPTYGSHFSNPRPFGSVSTQSMETVVRPCN